MAFLRNQRRRCCECLHGAWFGTRPGRVSLLSTWRSDSGRFESVAGRKENSAQSGRRFFLFRGALPHAHTRTDTHIRAGRWRYLAYRQTEATLLLLLLLPCEPTVLRFSEAQPATGRPQLRHVGCVSATVRQRVSRRYGRLLGGYASVRGGTVESRLRRHFSRLADKLGRERHRFLGAPTSQRGDAK